MTVTLRIGDALAPGMAVVWRRPGREDLEISFRNRTEFALRQTVTTHVTQHLGHQVYYSHLHAACQETLPLVLVVFIRFRGRLAEDGAYGAAAYGTHHYVHHGYGSGQFHDGGLRQSLHSRYGEELHLKVQTNNCI